MRTIYQSWLLCILINLASFSSGSPHRFPLSAGRPCHTAIIPLTIISNQSLSSFRLILWLVLGGGSIFSCLLLPCVLSTDLLGYSIAHGAAFCYQAKSGAIINIDYFRFARIRPSAFHIVEEWIGPIDPTYHQVAFLKF
ncbi:hypothetical protein BDR07DRAFT_202734 [Suillus spraguei]|nr:hypothetical protein BDR07DRAFT_202734 [Suillus spraguei]